MANQRPQHTIQMILSESDRQPDEAVELTTSFPNGHYIKIPSLKDCMPNGIPMMVRQRIIPPVK